MQGENGEQSVTNKDTTSSSSSGVTVNKSENKNSNGGGVYIILHAGGKFKDAAETRYQEIINSDYYDSKKIQFTLDRSLRIWLI